MRRASATAAASAQSRPGWDGGFTAAQADRGRAAYRESCAQCHGQDLAGGEGTPPLAGP
ncbi:MAG TPA: c-type cytochrome, partial [Polyangia bacterium]